MEETHQRFRYSGFEEEASERPFQNRLKGFKTDFYDLTLFVWHHSTGLMICKKWKDSSLSVETCYLDQGPQKLFSSSSGLPAPSESALRKGLGGQCQSLHGKGGFGRQLMDNKFSRCNFISFDHRAFSCTGFRLPSVPGKNFPCWYDVLIFFPGYMGCFEEHVLERLQRRHRSSVFASSKVHSQVAKKAFVWNSLPDAEG